LLKLKQLNDRNSRESAGEKKPSLIASSLELTLIVAE
jgi:hypothetical protein